jgi:hypothetical protein
MADQAKPVQANLSPVLTVAELCDYLRIHKTTLYRMIRAKESPRFVSAVIIAFTAGRLMSGSGRRNTLPRLPSLPGHPADSSRSSRFQSRPNLRFLAR